MEDEQRRELDVLYEDGYRRLPEDEAVGTAQVAVAGEVLPKESW